MFDSSGRPDGYGQYSPFTDSQQPPGKVPDQKPDPMAAGGGTPAAPSDPTMLGWRQPTNPRPLGGPHVLHKMDDPSQSPLQQAISGGMPTGQPQPSTPQWAGMPGQTPGGQPPPNPVQNGDYHAWWNNLTQGKPVDQQMLRQWAPQLQAANVLLTPGNKSAGDQTKIGIPTASGGRQWVRVIDGDPNVPHPSSWMVQPDGPQQQSPMMSAIGGLPAPDTTGSNNPLLAAIINQGLQKRQGY